MLNYKATEIKLIKIVKQASKLMLQSEFTVYQKTGIADIVTSTDIAVQKFLCDKLTKLLPDSGFLCEESDINDMQHRYVWVIDPIDGTTNFSRNIASCVISVALISEGEALVGVVYNPYTDEMFSASRGNGSKLNDRFISVSGKSFDDSLFCTAMSLYRKDLAPMCFDIIVDTYKVCNDIRRFGSCALELCYLASGKCDLYFEIRVFPWDYAAAYLILKEAGGILKGLNKEKLAFDKATPLVGANNKDNFNTLNKIVYKHLKNLPY